MTAHAGWEAGVAEARHRHPMKYEAAEKVAAEAREAARPPAAERAGWPGRVGPPAAGWVEDNGLLCLTRPPSVRLLAVGARHNVSEGSSDRLHDPGIHRGGRARPPPATLTKGGISGA